MSGRIDDFDFTDMDPEDLLSAESFFASPFDPLDPLHTHTPDDDRVFVFGSNLLGIHGAGAAAYARLQLGAEAGVGEGLTGRSYALPTCYRPGEPVTLQELAVYMYNFFNFADDHPELTFFLSKVGCGIAGFDEHDVAYIVHELLPPANVHIPPDWQYPEID